MQDRNKQTLLEVFGQGLRGGRKSIGTAESGFFSQWGWNTGATWSGKTVTVDTALQNDTVWACVKLISEAVSTLPLTLFERSPTGIVTPARDHTLYELLHYSPNQKMNATNFWQVVSTSLLLWGNAYVEVKRIGRRIVALDFLLPANMSFTRDNNGALVYHYRVGSVTREIATADMMHIRSFSLDGEVGLSSIQYGRNSIASALAADQASDETFRDSTRANGIVTMDTVMNAAQREQVRGHVATVAKNGGVYVLEKGNSYAPLTFNPIDAELLASRSFSVETICRWFRVPPVMIGHGDKQSSWPTSTEAQGALFLRYVLRACILGIEQEIRRSLLTPAERLTYYAQFGLEGLLRGDSAARAAFYSSMTQNGIMTRDECRGKEDLPDMGGNAAVLTVQSNMMPIDKLGQNIAAPTAAPPDLTAGKNLSDLLERTT